MNPTAAQTDVLECVNGTSVNDEPDTEDDTPLDDALPLSALLTEFETEVDADDELASGLALQHEFDTLEDAGDDNPDYELDVQVTLPELSDEDFSEDEPSHNIALGVRLDEEPSLLEDDAATDETPIRLTEDLPELVREDEDEAPAEGTWLTLSEDEDPLPSDKRFRLLWSHPARVTCLANHGTAAFAAGTHLLELRPNSPPRTVTRLENVARSMVLLGNETLLVTSMTGQLYCSIGKELSARDLPEAMVDNARTTGLKVFRSGDTSYLLTDEGHYWALGHHCRSATRVELDEVRNVAAPSAQAALVERRGKLSLYRQRASCVWEPASGFSSDSTTAILSCSDGIVAVATERDGLFYGSIDGESLTHVPGCANCSTLLVGMTESGPLAWLARTSLSLGTRLIETDLTTGKSTYVATLPASQEAPEDETINQLLWSPDERILYIARDDCLIALRRLEA